MGGYAWWPKTWPCLAQLCLTAFRQRPNSAYQMFRQPHKCWFENGYLGGLSDVTVMGNGNLATASIRYYANEQKHRALFNSRKAGANSLSEANPMKWHCRWQLFIIVESEKFILSVMPIRLIGKILPLGRWYVWRKVIVLMTWQEKLLKPGDEKYFFCKNQSTVCSKYQLFFSILYRVKRFRRRKLLTISIKAENIRLSVRLWSSMHILGIVVRIWVSGQK